MSESDNSIPEVVAENNKVKEFRRKLLMWKKEKEAHS
jgi:uncharacterized protein YlzI (FlbEa/FlbD family)